MDVVGSLPVGAGCAYGAGNIQGDIQNDSPIVDALLDTLDMENYHASDNLTSSGLAYPNNESEELLKTLETGSLDFSTHPISLEYELVEPLSRKSDSDTVSAAVVPPIIVTDTSQLDESGDGSAYTTTTKTTISPTTLTSTIRIGKTENDKEELANLILFPSPYFPGILLEGVILDLTAEMGTVASCRDLNDILERFHMDWGLSLL